MFQRFIGLPEFAEFSDISDNLGKTPILCCCYFALVNIEVCITQPYSHNGETLDTYSQFVNFKQNFL